MLIHKHLTAQSPYNRKSKYYGTSFGKQSRFKQQKSYCQAAFYNAPQLLTKMQTSFGFGNRGDFTKSKSCAPGCTRYNIPTCFNTEGGPSFGALKADGPYEQGILANPSPQNYRPKGMYARIGYSMRPKVENKWMPNFLQNHSPSKTPGPGQYQPQTKKRRISGVAIGKEDRFFMIRPSTPGPGDYHPVEQNSANFKWGGLRLNSRESRTSFVDSYAKQRQYSPAPGQYEAYSEFDIKTPLRSTSPNRQCRRSKTEQIF